jgi:hypothetical protein
MAGGGWIRKDESKDCWMGADSLKSGKTPE